jgi:hypothetical protein
MLIASPGDDQLSAAGRDQPGGRAVRNRWMLPGSRMARAVAGRSVVSAMMRDSVPGKDAGVSGLRDFLPVAVESGWLRSITL